MARLFGARADRRESFAAPRAPACRATAAAAGRLLIGFGSTKAAYRPGLATETNEEWRHGRTTASPWHVVTTPNTGPNDNDLWSVAGRSAADIWAVGSLLPSANATVVRTLALHYNGTRWARVKTADVGSEANSLYGVAALADGTAWGTGIYTPASGHTGRALTEHWNGHRWAAVPAADPGSAEDILYCVTAARESDVWAVGTDADASGDSTR